MLIVVKANNKNTRICNAVFIFHFQHIQQINLIFLIYFWTVNYQICQLSTEWKFELVENFMVTGGPRTG